MATTFEAGTSLAHYPKVLDFGLATRRRPFEADSDVDVTHKILHDKPVPIDEIAPRVPAELRRVIRRCLAKDPEKRYQSMKDLSLELSEIVEEFETLSASATALAQGGAPLADLTGSFGLSMRWNLKGDGLTFIRPSGGAENLFNQPLAGGPSTQLTHFRKN